MYRSMSLYAVKALAMLRTSECTSAYWLFKKVLSYSNLQTRNINMKIYISLSIAKPFQSNLPKTLLSKIDCSYMNEKMLIVLLCKNTASTEWKSNHSTKNQINEWKKNTIKIFYFFFSIWQDSNLSHVDLRAGQVSILNWHRYTMHQNTTIEPILRDITHVWLTI